MAALSGPTLLCGQPSATMRILHSLIFFPRGGSAFVARALALEAVLAGHDARIVAGSLGGPGDFGHAVTFYDGLPVYAMDYNDASAAFEAGGDPLGMPSPFHPSYEDRGRVPDRIFAAVSPDRAAWSAHAWEVFYQRVASEFHPDVIHVHHLTPQMKAIRAALPGVPVLNHLHGTEIKLVEALQAGAFSTESAPYGDYWVKEFASLAKLGQATIALCPSDMEKAQRLLDVKRGNLDWIPNGIDSDLFKATDGTSEGLGALLDEFLVTDARGWDEGGHIGFIRYTDAHVRRLVELHRRQVPFLIFVGRFLGVKRLDLLLQCVARLRERGIEAPLVIWGGYPGEVEGEHPWRTVQRLGLSDVYFVGWRDQKELAALLPHMKLLVLPSRDESFGQVLVEAMSCGVAVVAANRGGPLAFVHDGNGWLFEVDNLDSLHDTLMEAISDSDRLVDRGRAASIEVRDKYTWNSIFGRFLAHYERLVGSFSAWCGTDVVQRRACDRPGEWISPPSSGP